MELKGRKLSINLMLCDVTGTSASTDYEFRGFVLFVFRFCFACQEYLDELATPPPQFFKTMLRACLTM